MDKITEYIVNQIRHNPSVFLIVCISIALVFIFLSNPGVITRVSTLLSLVAAGVFILVRQVFSLLTAIESFILGLLRSTFEQLQRLLK